MAERVARRHARAPRPRAPRARAYQDGQWYTFNDGEVSRAEMGATADERLQRDAYVLFYRSRSLGQPPPGIVSY